MKKIYGYVVVCLMLVQVAILSNMQASWRAIIEGPLITALIAVCLVAIYSLKTKFVNGNQILLPRGLWIK
ncbi:hypothetical protein KKC52_12270 [bacterium]|nr:hypothetical protein [bacterium]MBU1987743.1 hypothetical protein [Patescibacteria group bacterium]